MRSVDDLAESEGRHLQVFEIVFDGYAIVEQARISEASPRFCTLLGLTRRLVRGQPIAAQFPPEFRAEIESALETPGTRELSIADDRASLSDVEIGTAPVQYHGRNAVLFALRDLSALRKRARAIATSERLIALGQAAAGAAHEINNPLAFVSLSLSKLASHNVMTALREQDAEIATLLDDINLGIDRMLYVARDLRHLSAEQERPKQPVCLREVLHAAARITGVEIHNRAAFTCEIGEVPLVWGDPGRLTQVFINLLLNAARSIAPGRPESNRVSLRLRQERASTVAVEVEDTGTGIATDVLPKIFDPFFTTRPHGQGAGLGLAISKRIIEGHGGEIRVATSPSGTMFSVLLPASQALRSAAAAPSGTIIRAPRQRLLIIDDEAALLRAMKRSLEHHDVTTAASGEEGIALAMKSNYDVVLCDMMMPGMGGVEVYERLLSVRRTDARRFVFFSGGAVSLEGRDFLGRYPGCVLEKPVDLDFLEQYLMRLAADHLRGGR